MKTIAASLSVAALIAVSFVISIVLSLPSQAGAQETGTPSAVYCPNLTVTLQFGSRDSSTGGQVTQLQKFLSDYYDLDPATYVTGYFGNLTKQNVKRFQCEKDIVCSGDESTGWGVVGPRTRAAIVAACGNGGGGGGGGQTPVASITVNNQQEIEVPPGTIYRIAWHSSRSLSCLLSAVYGSGATSSSSVASNTNGSSLGVTIGGWAEHTLSCKNSYGEASKTARASDETNANQPCTLDGVIVAHGQSWTFYSSSAVQSPTTCQSVSQVRSCQNGALTGSLIYNKASCASYTTPPPVVSLAVNGQPSATVASTTLFTITAHSANVLSCTGSRQRDTETATSWTPPVNTSASFNDTMSGNRITYTMTCTASSTSPISKTVTITPQSGGGGGGGPAPHASSCTYKGTTYQEGSTINVPNSTGSSSVICDNSVWVMTGYQLGTLACESGLFMPQERNNMACTDADIASNRILVAYTPRRHGIAPLTVTVDVTNAATTGSNQCGGYTFSWGDGASDTAPVRPSNPNPNNCPIHLAHTYISPGAYIINFSVDTALGTKISSANIRVDP